MASGRDKQVQKAEFRAKAQSYQVTNDTLYYIYNMKDRATNIIRSEHLIVQYFIFFNICHYIGIFKYSFHFKIIH